MTTVHDSSGIAIGQENPMYVQGSIYSSPKMVMFTDTTANLATTDNFTGTARDIGVVPLHSTYRIRVFADQPITLDVYAGTSATLTTNRIQQTQSVAANTMLVIDVPIVARYIGIKITNTGASTTTSLEVLTALIA